MAEENDLPPAHIDGCIPAPQRRTLEQLAARDKNIMYRKPGPAYLSGRPASQYLDIVYATTSGPFPLAVIKTFFQEGVLADNLLLDDTATLNLYDPETDAVYSPNRTIEVDGFYVPDETPAVMIPSGARIGAQWNGVCWRAIVANTCTVPVPE